MRLRILVTTTLVLALTGLAGCSTVKDRNTSSSLGDLAGTSWNLDSYRSATRTAVDAAARSDATLTFEDGGDPDPPREHHELLDLRRLARPRGEHRLPAAHLRRGDERTRQHLVAGDRSQQRCHPGHRHTRSLSTPCRGPVNPDAARAVSRKRRGVQRVRRPREAWTEPKFDGARSRKGCRPVPPIIAGPPHFPAMCGRLPASTSRTQIG